MYPQVVDSLAKKQVEEPTVPVVQSTNRLNNITIISMALFVLLSLSSVAFLYYQNQQLKTMLAKYQTPIGSPKPLAQVAIPDPTANWQTYASKKYNFEIKYPNAWPYKLVEFGSASGIGERFTLGKNVEVLVTDPGLSKAEILRNRANAIDTNTNGTEQIDVESNSSAIGGNGPDLKQIERYFLLPKQTVLISYSEINSGDFQRDKQTFDQILSTFKFSDQTSTNPIVITPVANTKVSSPLVITGTVPVGWMFEGSFPIQIADSSKSLVAQGAAKEVIKGSWQSGKPVDFTVTLPFSTTDSSGFLILFNDNASGDPAKSKTFEVPLKF